MLDQTAPLFIGSILGKNVRFYTSPYQCIRHFLEMPWCSDSDVREALGEADAFAVKAERLIQDHWEAPYEILTEAGPVRLVPHFVAMQILDILSGDLKEIAKSDFRLASISALAKSDGAKSKAASQIGANERLKAA